MPSRRRSGPVFASQRKRRRSLARPLLGVAAIAGIWGAGTVVGDQGASTSDRPPAPPPLRILAGEKVVAQLATPTTEQRLRAELRRKLPTAATLLRGRARIMVRYPRQATVDAASTLLIGGGDVQAFADPYAARLPAPAVRQAQRNTCESAALHILLATLGTDVSQGRLQAALPVSGGPDPVARDGKQIWGDPDKGYVGRPAGGGIAGGFGAYPSPVRKAAAKFDVKLQDLTGEGPAAIYRRLLSGRAVMTWIGLSDGPYARWTSPQGKAIRVNFGEHTVVLHGIDESGRLEVSNPLQGTRERWSKGKFEVLFKRLGQRAVAAR